MHAPKDSFYGLEPETIFRAIESLGLRPTGELRQLNSYENRVFELHLEEAAQPGVERVVAKFYRPGRWSQEAIQEEHDFLHELADEQIPVAEPLRFENVGSSVLLSPTVAQVDNLFFTVFPKIFGRMPDEILPDEVEKVGRLMAQVHNIGAKKKFKHRPELGQTPWNLWQTLEFLHTWVAVEMWPRYEKAAIELIENFESSLDTSSFQRIHGDFHRGNLLANKNGFLLVDFDDCMQGPVIQDFWMILQGLEEEDRVRLIQGYESLREFPDEQMQSIPLLRGLRILNYAAWIARRWEDPSFPRLFPEFGTYRYWAEETEALEAMVRSLAP